MSKNINIAILLSVWGSERILFCSGTSKCAFSTFLDRKMTTRTNRMGGEKQQVASGVASLASRVSVSPSQADGIPQWAQDMMSEIKKANAAVTKYREETKTEIAKCKEEIEKGRKEMTTGLEKWTKSLEESTRAQSELLRGEVKLVADKIRSLADMMDKRKN